MINKTIKVASLFLMAVIVASTSATVLALNEKLVETSGCKHVEYDGGNKIVLSSVLANADFDKIHNMTHFVDEGTSTLHINLSLIPGEDIEEFNGNNFNSVLKSVGTKIVGKTQIFNVQNDTSYGCAMHMFEGKDLVINSTGSIRYLSSD